MGSAEEIWKQCWRKLKLDLFVYSTELSPFNKLIATFLCVLDPHLYADAPPVSDTVNFQDLPQSPGNFRCANVLQVLEFSRATSALGYVDTGMKISFVIFHTQKYFSHKAFMSLGDFTEYLVVTGQDHIMHLIYFTICWTTFG